MAFATKVTDWQVCGLGGAAGAAGIAVGLYRFIFYSQSAGVSESFNLRGAGIGVGGNASGTTLPQDFGDYGSPWSSLDCDRAFSAADLRGAWGRFTTAGAGDGVQVAIAYLTAAAHFWSTESFFHSQYVGGFGIGVGASALTITGTWRHAGSSVFNPNNFPGSSGDTTVA